MLSMTASSKQSEMEGKRLSYSELVGYLQVKCTLHNDAITSSFVCVIFDITF